MEIPSGRPRFRGSPSLSAGSPGAFSRFRPRSESRLRFHRFRLGQFDPANRLEAIPISDRLKKRLNAGITCDNRMGLP